MEFFRMLRKSPGDKLSLSARWNTREANEQNARVDQTLAENKFAKIFIRCQQNGNGLTAPEKNGLIVDPRLEFSYRLNAVAVGTKALDDLLIHIFVCDDIQLTFSKG